MLLVKVAGISYPNRLAASLLERVSIRCYGLPLPDFTLAALTQLDCISVFASEDDPFDWLPGLPALQWLSLNWIQTARMRGGAAYRVDVPHGLMRCTGLTHLRLSWVSRAILKSLPAGSYLHRLRQLALPDIPLLAAPLSLTQATALTEVHLQMHKPAVGCLDFLMALPAIQIRSDVRVDARLTTLDCCSSDESEASE